MNYIIDYNAMLNITGAISALLIPLSIFLINDGKPDAFDRMVILKMVINPFKIISAFILLFVPFIFINNCNNNWQIILIIIWFFGIIIYGNVLRNIYKWIVTLDDKEYKNKKRERYLNNRIKNNEAIIVWKNVWQKYSYVDEESTANIIPIFFKQIELKYNQKYYTEIVQFQIDFLEKIKPSYTLWQNTQTYYFDMIKGKNQKYISYVSWYFNETLLYNIEDPSVIYNMLKDLSTYYNSIKKGDRKKLKSLLKDAIKILIDKIDKDLYKKRLIDFNLEIFSLVSEEDKFINEIILNEYIDFNIKYLYDNDNKFPNNISYISMLIFQKSYYKKSLYSSDIVLVLIKMYVACLKKDDNLITRKNNEIIDEYKLINNPLLGWDYANKQVMNEDDLNMKINKTIDFIFSFSNKISDLFRRDSNINKISIFINKLEQDNKAYEFERSIVEKIKEINKSK